jgi:predicted RNA binding protein YcfA (HicA-like mRNA interferase family)
MKAKQLLAILHREPLKYEVVKQNGSHRKMESANGHPPLLFSFHDKDTIPPGLVRKILVNDVGLAEADARNLC